ncbi:MAG: homoserine O-acetyltransferase [Candidatus Latescibacteria bacterium]|jgi:homoserine O-acetyltransferase/O-succinyltransferase|nr:homoserine O-acetyltransferase [Candidatus Latescibacterota bacterium]
MDTNSVGLVKEQQFTFASAEDPMKLESGHTLGPIDIVYETYGEPNEDKSNAILILHALSGDAHVAGYHHPNDKRTGWWDVMVGPGKGFDTSKYWVICSNIIGGCKGTTGPGSINPQTGKHYCQDFPIITVGDMVEAQKKLMDHLGISKLYSLAGGSMGGFQVIEWILRFPEMTRSAICIASCARLSAQSLAFNAVGRKAITMDPGWNDGCYYGTPGPIQGLAIARMIGHITYLSDLSLDSRFGRKLQSADRFSYDFTTEFAIESYLQYQGQRFTERFDANSYLYLTKAMDYFDIARSYGSLDKAFAAVKAKCLFMSYNSDWLFTSEQSREIVQALKRNKKDVSFIEINSPYGHDAFLTEYEQPKRIIVPFLDSVGKKKI